MRRLRTRRARMLAVLMVMAVAAAVIGTTAMRGDARWEHPSAFALSKGDADQQDTPGGTLGAPNSYLAQQIAALAYPSNALRASVMNNERNYFDAHIKGRAFAAGGAWHLVGPTTSTQPAVLNFFDFQSSDFQVSGRVTAMAVAPNCNAQSCMLWVAAAGGGVWRNANALDPSSPWKYVSGSFGTNAIGTLTYVPETHSLYAGTGEPNASGDSEAGVGIYESKDNGDHWRLLPGSVPAMNARSISSIVVDPNNPKTLYVGTTRGVRGVSGVAGGAVSLAPDAAPWGLWKSTDGGNHFAFVWDGNGSLRGVNHVELDSAHNTLYAAAFQQGIWRSTDGGTTWEQVFATQDAAENTARTEFALNTTSDGHTRIYVNDGGTETDTSVFPPLSNTAVYRGDAIDTKSAADLVTGGTDGGYVKLTSDSTADPTYDTCETQCWYDNYVVSPAGHPDMVYIGGSFDYNLYAYGLNDGRAVMLSQDAGATWTDQTRDMQGAACGPGTNCTGIHPDQHALVTDPANPLIFFEGSDGGVIHSSGQLTDASSSCPTDFGAFTTSCQEELSAIPTKLTTLNAGLSTLQFQNVTVNPNQPTQLMGGTQDNGTWLGPKTTSNWDQTIYGDGGVAAFDASNPNYELNEFYSLYTDGNFEGGDPTKWVILSGPLFASGEGSEFYKPQIGDPVVGGTFFVGLQHVFRTQDYGGDKTFLEANCPEFTTPGDDPSCGDFVALGGPAGPGNAGDLTSSNYGDDRTGGFVAALARAKSDTSTLWAATATGRVFISKNADASDPESVSFTRLDSTAPHSPGRFVSGIVVDPTDPNLAFISYSGYNANTPSQPGHVFEVRYDPNTQSARWTDLDHGRGPLGDMPVTGLARDDSTGTLYAATDFGVLASKPNRDGTYDGFWAPAAAGMPEVEVPWLTIDQSTHTLYAATHGRGIWQLSLGGNQH